jgi:cyclopropane-fatty-acyl-phospholipid synthase
LKKRRRPRSVTSPNELGFRYASLAVFQIQLSHQQAAVPLTRDYITGSERGLVRSNSGNLQARSG